MCRSLSTLSLVTHYDGPCVQHVLPFSQVVVVAIGRPAYEFCKERQNVPNFNHSCVLDPYCFLDRNMSSVSSMEFNSLSYNMATVQVGTSH